MIEGVISLLPNAGTTAMPSDRTFKGVRSGQNVKTFEKLTLEEVDKLINRAKKGSLAAQLTLANLYETDKGHLNVGLAAMWYLEAAENGSPEAQAKIGELYLNGVGIARDYQEAIKAGSTMVRIGSLIFGERIYNR